MIEIRSLYTKYVYIQDCYLGRNTSYQLDFDFCGFIRSVSHMNSVRESMSIPSSERRGLTEYEAGFSPSENEKKASGRKRYTIREARENALKFIAIAEKEYQEAIEHSNAIMGKEWTENFLENFSKEKVKNEDSRFIKLKQEYNCLIKTIKTWSEDDKDYYHMLLQEIFTYDEEFLKYMPKNIKEKLSEHLKRTSMFFSFVNSCCTNHPDYVSNKLNRKTAPRLPRNTDPLERLFSSLTGVNDDYDKGTIKGGVNIVDIDANKEKEEKEKAMRWRYTRSDAIDKSNSLVEEIVNLYHYLGDALELTPWQLGLSPVNCNCPNKVTHIETYRNTLMKSVNRFVKNKETICDKKDELDRKKMKLEQLRNTKLIYENAEKESKNQKSESKLISEWVETKGGVKAKSRTKTVGLETSNRFDCLYENSDEIIEAGAMADRFLSVSENLNIIFDWKAYKARNKYVKKKMKEELFLDNNIINKIKTNNGASPLKKYNVKNIRDVLVIIQLCYNKKIHPDFKYLKETYGIKRCQSKFLLVSLNIMIKKLIKLEDEKIELKKKRFKQS